MNNLEYLEPTFYQYVPNGGVLNIDEKEQSGYMNLQLTVHGESIRFSIKPNKGFFYFKIKNTPDHLVFTRVEDEWELHIFECKRSVGESEWKKIKKQFAGGLLHAKLLASLLDVGEFSHIKIYTVYQHDKLLAKSTNPVALRQPVGTKIMKKEFEDWTDPSIKVLPDRSAIQHERIQLKIDGTANWEII